jgi:hypothetical protein
MMASLHPFHIFVEVHELQLERILKKRKKRVCEKEKNTLAQKNYNTSLISINKIATTIKIKVDSFHHLSKDEKTSG